MNHRAIFECLLESDPKPTLNGEVQSKIVRPASEGDRGKLRINTSVWAASQMNQL